ncbi:MAG: P1 family peptidase [Geminicoccaceae bacterium]
MIRIGARNTITDVDGILVGNADDLEACTGTTVVFCEAPAVAAVDVGGGAPGTREIALLDPACSVEAIDAVVLSGGSAFGLAAAEAVLDGLADQDRGVRVGGAQVPIVPAAILFDLLIGDEPAPLGPLYRSLGAKALADIGSDVALGNHGAGVGATAGRVKGGLGSASFCHEKLGVTVGALAAVNAHGEAVTPDRRQLWAAPFEQDLELGSQGPLPAISAAELAFDRPAAIAENTTLVVVATDARLTKAQAKRVALMAKDGFARALRPVHTPFDGDTVFVLATGKQRLEDPLYGVLQIGMLAADCVTRAIARGVYEARSLGGFPAYRDLRSA